MAVRDLLNFPRASAEYVLHFVSEFIDQTVNKEGKDPDRM